MAEQNQTSVIYSTASEANGQIQPGRKLLDSRDAGWTSVLLQIFEQPPMTDAFETLASPDQTIVLTTAGEYEIESFSHRSWKRALYTPGHGGATAPFHTSRLRWKSDTSETIRTLHLYIPQPYFEEAAEEYRRAGVRLNGEPLDALIISDPLIYETAKSLAAAVELGAPDLHADAAARWLATHLLSTQGRIPARSLQKNPGYDLTDRRMTRVLDYMQHHFMRQITIDELAREAGISRFHFVRLFKRALGFTPHQQLVRLRLEHARALLAGTDLPVSEIATACGYVHAGHFAAAFQQQFSTSPAAYRRKLRL